MVQKYVSFHFSVEDYVSIALNAVLVALKKFESGKASFYNFWTKVAMNEIGHFIRENVKLAKMDNLLVASIDDENSHYTISDSARHHDLIQLGLHESIIKAIKKDKDFTPMEKTVIEYYLDGYEISEIAILLNRSKSSIYYHFSEAIKKLRQVMK